MKTNILQESVEDWTNSVVQMMQHPSFQQKQEVSRLKVLDIGFQTLICLLSVINLFYCLGDECRLLILAFLPTMIGDGVMLLRPMFYSLKLLVDHVAQNLVFPCRIYSSLEYTALLASIMSASDLNSQILIVQQFFVAFWLNRFAPQDNISAGFSSMAG